MEDELVEDRLNAKPISMEEAFGRQNDRIAYLRSMGHPWAEAVFQLRDMIVGLEDEEFWDGIPDAERKRLQDLPVEEQEEVRRTWACHGWNGFPVRARRGPNGPVWRPTPEDLSQAYRIVMRLAARQGLAWKKRRRSRLAPPRSPDEPQRIDD